MSELDRKPTIEEMQEAMDWARNNAGKDTSAWLEMVRALQADNARLRELIADAQEIIETVDVLYDDADYPQLTTGIRQWLDRAKAAAGIAKGGE